MNKERYNVTLTESVREKGERLAEQDVRSFSAEVAFLILEECKRRNAMLIESPNMERPRKAA